MYQPRPGERGRGPRFWPNHIANEMASAICFMGLIVLLAGFFPKGLHPPADPFTTPEHIKPEWYFLALYQVLKIVPKTLMGIEDFNKPFTLMFSGVVALFMLALPWIDRTPSTLQHPLRRPYILIFTVLGIIGFVGLTLWGLVSK
ncbi:MAG TPA: cytochrome b subunit of the bc complex [Firmicutes bacterium]|nr:cytochrome b subunit of the bc complex [Bacillota bacterium]